MKDYSQLSDFDIFFYYAENGGDVDLEIQSDVLMGLTQPKKLLFYDNQEGAGVKEKENSPLSLIFQIGVSVNIVNWISKRNTEVTDGTNGTTDRRVAISQQSIQMQYDDKGQLQISATYIPFKDAKNPNTSSLPISINV